MALTMTALWEESRLNLRARRVVVVSVTDGSSTWLIGTQDMNLTDGHVHQAVINIGDIESGFDLYSKKWIVPSVQITLSNAPYTRDDTAGSRIRLSDQLIGIRNQAVSIYFFKGDRMTSLSDALQRFKGVALLEPTFDNNQLVIQAGARQFFSEMDLPRYTVQDSLTAGTYGAQAKACKIPLAYGKYVCESDTTLMTGAMATVDISVGIPQKYLVSDHVLHALSYGYVMFSGTRDWSRIESATETLDEGGRGTFTPTSTGAFIYLMAYLRPADSFEGDYSIPATNDSIVDMTTAVDHNIMTWAEIMDGEDNGTYNAGAGEFAWPDYNPQDSESYGFRNSNWYVDVLIQLTNGTAGYYTEVPECRLYYGPGSPYASYLDLGNLTLTTSKVLNAFTVDYDVDPPTAWTRWKTWKLRSRSDPDSSPATSDDSWPFLIWIGMLGGATGTPDPNSVTMDQCLAKVYDIRLRIPHQVVAGLLGSVWIEGEGAEYDTWISSRSSNYAAGDVIEDPAGIVESICRDVLQLPTAQIDAPSFIAAENTSVKMRVNLYDDFVVKSMDLLRMIAEQSTFAVVWSALDQVRLIDLADKTPSTQHVIPFSHVRDGIIKVSTTNVVRNQLVIQSRWRNELGGYEDDNGASPIEDTVSQAALDAIFKYSAGWRFLAGDSVNTVGDLYVNATDGLWSKDHRILQLETIGDLWAHIQDGDWCELDSTTFDPQLKLAGASWSGKQFMATKVAQSLTGTKMTLMQLWD